MYKNTATVFTALLFSIITLTLSGCGTNIRQSVYVAEEAKFNEMVSQLEDAKSKINQFCGQGTAEAAAIETAISNLGSKYQSYQQASQNVYNVKTQKSANLEKIAELQKQKRDKERELTSLNQQVLAYNSGQHGPYYLLFEKHRSDPLDFDNVRNIRTWADRLKQSCANHVQAANDQLQILSRNPAATPDMINQATALKNNTEFDFNDIDRIWGNIYLALNDNDSDALEAAFLRLATFEAKMQHQVAEIERLNIDAQIQAVPRITDQDVADAQTAYDQAKRDFDQAMTDASNALSTGRAKAIQCAGTDVFADGTPIFPGFPPNWNSTFWDISSP